MLGRSWHSIRSIEQIPWWFASVSIAMLSNVPLAVQEKFSGYRRLMVEAIAVSALRFRLVRLAASRSQFLRLLRPDRGLAVDRRHLLEGRQEAETTTKNE
jgi:hypothetical protein